MKRAWLTVICVAVAVSAEAQPASTPGGWRIGVGAAVSNMPAMLVPIDIKWLRVEPEIGLTHTTATQELQVVPLVLGTTISSANITQDQSITTLATGAGLFFAPSHDRIKLLVGARVGYARNSISSTASYPGAPSLTSETKLTGFFVGPSVGGEYFLADRFSLGAELQARYTSLDGSQQASPTIYSQTVLVTGIPTIRPTIIPSPATSTSQSSFVTRASVVARLYFK
jgi:Outer membrane protein beta-barrel domain